MLGANLLESQFVLSFNHQNPQLGLIALTNTFTKQIGWVIENILASSGKGCCVACSTVPYSLCSGLQSQFFKRQIQRKNMRLVRVFQILYIYQWITIPICNKNWQNEYGDWKVALQLLNWACIRRRAGDNRILEYLLDVALCMTRASVTTASSPTTRHNKRLKAAVGQVDLREGGIVSATPTVSLARRTPLEKGTCTRDYPASRIKKPPSSVLCFPTTHSIQ